MSRGAQEQLQYAAGFRRTTLVHGARLEAEALQDELARVVRGNVVFLDQRAVVDPKAVLTAAAKADTLHVACDYVITTEVLDAIREAQKQKPKAPFIVVSTRALQLSDLDRSVQKIFPIIIAWGEVF